jgi:low affinity Fe/Cu permease
LSAPAISASECRARQQCGPLFLFKPSVQATEPEKSTSIFSKLAAATAHAAGRPAAFLVSAAIVIGWAISGPIFAYSDTWQLVINTGTTIITFLMVFLIQNTQNRDTMALQLKLDELIIATKRARNSVAGIEECTEEELEAEKELERRRATENADGPASV